MQDTFVWNSCYLLGMRESDIDPLYFVLGAVNEYNGRTIRSDQPDFVDLFFSDEEGAAEIFHIALDELAQQRGIAERIIVHKQEGLTTFRSAELAGLINGQYTVVQPSYMIGARELFISNDAFATSLCSEELSYLVGAHSRFGSGLTFRMANAQHKIDVVARLLHKHGFPQIKVSYHPDYVPRVFVLSFERNGVGGGI